MTKKMTDNLNKERRKKHKIDLDLKRTRDRFKLKSTLVTITEALDAATELTTFDRERVLAQLQKHRADFKHAPDTKAFRAQIAAWIAKQARYIARFREMLPALKIDDRTATLLLLRLPEFNGSDEEFPTWVTATAKHEADGLKALAEWITLHRVAVYRGIRRVLRSCRDLHNCLDDVADCLASETWAYVSNHVTEFLNPPRPISDLLSDFAESLARAWKSERLRSDEPRPAIGYFVGMNGLERTIKDSNGLEIDAEIDADTVRDSNSDLNPIIIGGILWPKDLFNYEVRRVHREHRNGPFRADDIYNDAKILAAA